MVGRDKLFSVIERALECSPGDETEAVISASDSYLTRFSKNYIHQNVGEIDSTLSLRVVIGQRIGRASTNSLSEAAVREAVNTAAEIARLQKPNPEYESLPSPGPVRDVPAWDDATAECPAMQRADAVKTIAERCASAGIEASGAFSTSSHELAVGNSHGVRGYHPYTVADLSLVAMSPESSGYAAQTSNRLSGINPGRAAEEAARLCLDGRGARAVEPGDYEVILQPHAVITLVAFLARLAFSARAYQEGRSPLVGRLGQKLVHESVTLWDDGLDPAGMPLPFDFEGVPKRRLELISAGVAANLVYDSFTAGKEGRESTGHATPGGYGPMPANLFFGTGGVSLEEMIAGTRRGLLVTRFHYTNPVHPVRTIITGMTRDGTFLVENGRIAGPVKNLRFTQSITDALSSLEAIGNRPVLAGGRIGGISVPALKIGRFTFTGVTEF
jgi:predicted Zn-dependent protease